MEGTLSRTKKHLNYFSKSFCMDKVALSLCVMIVLTLGGIIAVAIV
jgi:hypothetical protein